MKSRYEKYSYWYRPGPGGSTGYIVSNRHREDNPAEPGDVFLGKWYRHEKTPYIERGGQFGWRQFRISRDYYSHKLVFDGLYAPGAGWGFRKNGGKNNSN